MATAVPPQRGVANVVEQQRQATQVHD